VAITQYREWSSIPGHDLQFPAVSQETGTDQVHLPQFHRLVALPALTTAAGLAGHQLEAQQDPVDRRPVRQRTHPAAAQLGP